MFLKQVTNLDTRSLMFGLLHNSGVHVSICVKVLQKSLDRMPCWRYYLAMQTFDNSSHQGFYVRTASLMLCPTLDKSKFSINCKTVSKSGQIWRRQIFSSNWISVSKCTSLWNSTYAELKAHTHIRQCLTLSQNSWEGIKIKFNYTFDIPRRCYRMVVKVGSDRQVKVWKGTINSNCEQCWFHCSPNTRSLFHFVSKFVIISPFNATFELFSSSYWYAFSHGLLLQEELHAGRQSGFPMFPLCMPGKRTKVLDSQSCA